MKIALINTLYPPDTVGGAERSVGELARSLVKSGHEVLVVTLGPADQGTQSFNDSGVAVVRIGSRAYGVFERGGKHESPTQKLMWHAGELARLRTARALKQVLRSFAPSVIHANNLAGFGWLGWRTAHLSDALFVQTLRDYYFTCLTTTNRHDGHDCGWRHPLCRLSKAPFLLTRSRPDIFVGVSASIVRQHRRMGIIRKADNSEVVYNKPDVQWNTATKSVGSDLHEAPLYTFGLLGRLSADKGAPIAIKAFLNLPDEIKKRSRLILAGNASLADQRQLEEAAQGLPNVQFVGWQESSVFFALVDCVLVPSQWEEPFGRIAAETLQVGRTALLSAAGALPEVAAIYGGHFEILANYQEADAWTRAMVDAVNGVIPLRSATSSNTESPAQSYLRLYLAERSTDA